MRTDTTLVEDIVNLFKKPKTSEPPPPEGTGLREATPTEPEVRAEAIRSGEIAELGSREVHRSGLFWGLEPHEEVAQRNKSAVFV